MGNEKRSLSNLLGGVSERPPSERMDNQMSVLENALIDPLEGLMKRPPWTGGVPLDSAGIADESWFLHTITRGTGRDIVRVQSGDVAVVDGKTGAARTVYNITPDSYLSGTDFRAVTIGDTTVLVNRAVTTRQGKSRAPDPVREAMIFVRQADFSTLYTVNLDKRTVRHQTVDGDSAAARVGINTDSVAEALVGSLQGDLVLGPAFTFERRGSSFRMRRTDGADFIVNTTDGLADKGLRVIKGTVQSLEDLPTRAWGGMVLQVTGDTGSPKDDLWVRYEETGGPNSDGVWRECPAPGSPLDFDLTTMPHLLVRNGPLFPPTAHQGNPAGPITTHSAESGWTGGWTENAAGAAKDPTQDYVLTEHGELYRGVITNPINATRVQLTATYSINTTGMDQGIRATVELYGPADELLASRTYKGGFVVQTDTLSADLVLTTGGKAKIKLTYSNGLTPVFKNRVAQLTLQGVNSPVGPGLRVTPRRTISIDFGATTLYPPGAAFTTRLAVSGGSYSTFGYSVPAGSVMTGTAVATALASVINAHASFSAAATAGVINAQLDVSGTINGVTTLQIGSSLTFFSTDLVLPTVTSSYVGWTLKNLTDGSAGTITTIGTNYITVSSLTGGVKNTLTRGDLCTVVSPLSEYYTLNTAPWATRSVGNLELNPYPSFINRPITDVAFHANRLVFTSGDSVLFSAAGDLLRFTRSTLTDFLADDPIDLRSTHQFARDFDRAIPWETGLCLLSSTGNQFLLTGSPNLTAATAQIEHLGALPVDSRCKPAVIGNRLYFAKLHGAGAHVMEMAIQRSDDGVKANAMDLCSECPKLFKGAPVGIAGDASIGRLFFLTNDNGYARLYSCTQTFQEGGERGILAWSEWTGQPGHRGILHMGLQEGVLYAVRMLSLQTIDSVRLDLMNLNNLLVDNGSNYVDASGHAYQFWGRPGPFFIRAGQGKTIIDGRTQVHYLHLEYRNVRNLKVRVTQPGRAPKTMTKVHTNGGSGIFKVPIMAENTKAVIDVLIDSPCGGSLVGALWEGHYSSR